MMTSTCQTMLTCLRLRPRSPCSPATEQLLEGAGTHPLIGAAAGPTAELELFEITVAPCLAASDPRPLCGFDAELSERPLAPLAPRRCVGGDARRWCSLWR
jgi:hypothetical protein